MQIWVINNAFNGKGILILQLITWYSIIIPQFGSQIKDCFETN